MAKEPNQAKWVGIRPTDPSENIPVTESAPLSDILVAPSAGNPQFETLTKKRAPAIGDLQAFKDHYRQTSSLNNQNCTVAESIRMAVVPVDEIWVITNISMINTTSMCDMDIKPKVAGIEVSFKNWYSVPANTRKTWSGILVMTNDDLVIARWLLGGATDDIAVNVLGYKIGVY